MKSLESIVGRQGIYRGSQVMGYELLFRGPMPNGVRPTDSEMTAEVVFGAYNIGLDNLVDDKLIFCNAGRETITGSVPLMLPPHRTVVEILETVEVDSQVEHGVATLVDAGYRIALDDYDTKTKKLLPYASIVKIDLKHTEARALPGLIDQCQPFGVELLAEKVEDPARIPALMDLGFTLFQGYALDYPIVLSGYSLAKFDTSRLRAIVHKLGPQPDMDSVESLLRHNPALAYLILRLASHEQRGTEYQGLSSLRQALATTGLDVVRQWLSLLLARPAVTRRADEAIVTCLVRARVCELLADQLAGADSDIAFIAGLLSGFGRVLKMPLADMINQLWLRSDLSEAAVGGVSPLGQLVQEVAEYRPGPADQLRTRSPKSAAFPSTDNFDMAFASASTWARDALGVAA